MFVLAIDTSSPAVTAGIVTVPDGSTDPAELEVAAERMPLAARGHGELLTPAIADCLAELTCTPSDVAAVVAGVGPGPFTGLRVGLATAAAFADAVGVPVYGTCSLDAIGLATADEADLVVVTDARRREVYWARYSYGARVGEIDVVRPAAVPVDGTTKLAGAAVELYREVWPDLTYRPEQYPNPLALVALALDQIQDGAPTEVLTPLYLRRPDAMVPGAPKTVLPGARTAVGR